MVPRHMKRPTSLSWSGLTAELKRRDVYPVIVAYAVVAWILLQIGEVTFEPLGLPAWMMPALIIVVAAGFPVAILIAWHYDITPFGVRRDRRRELMAESGDRPSIAVLPFADMSPEQDQGYFCEGVAEEILNALTRIRQIKVAARTSSFRFDSSSGDVRDVGRRLGVKAILEGSVRKADDRLRVTAQLVKVEDGYHLWSKSFDASLADIFAIQDEIASNIAQALLETLRPDEQTAIRTARSSDVNAYDFYLRGRQYIKRFRKKDIEHARQMFRQAIDLDAGFALAWAGYADSYSLLVMYADPAPEYAKKANEASQRAIGLGPELAEVHASRGLACLVSRKFESAEDQFRRALELNPALFEAYYFYARARFHQGDMKMAAELFREAASVDPSDYQSRLLRVQILRGAGEIETAMAEAKEAVAVVERHLEWNPDDARAFHLGAGSLILLGQFDRARRWMRRALELDPDDPIVLYNVACNFATMNDVDESLKYLERAIEKGTVSSDWMRNDEDLAKLRNSPRFLALLEQVVEREAENLEGGESC
jgi:adenylate cyclase